ncbi:DUF5777 family beta-barrel protein [Sulfurovum sp.]|uniref:DUF5777 family beta-barrel protein n=1 Tax=Sulfurovum sp. TaxID=1969726 RepID=UPI0017F6EEC9|nr:DUF5777 family beta-barrel protein [Sulfurovum sp.]HFU77463.1 hypothetical protein [Campylobacterota bacterium]
MKKIVLLAAMAFFSEGAMAYEAGQLSLDTPNVLKQNEGSFGIRHRFYGKADDYEKFLGSDDGGNMYISLKYAVLDNLVIGVDHTRDQSGYGLGLEYAKDFSEYGSAGIRLNTFSIDDFNFEDRQKSYFINAAYQTPNFLDHIRFTANVGYDKYYQHTTLGLGLDINMKNTISWLTFTENMSLLAEYYPQVDKVEGISGDNDSYAFGVKFQTFKHHFEILLTNSSNMDPRTMALGTNSEDLHFGFNINRKF